METLILTILQFDVNLPPATTFLENYSRAIQVCDPRVLIKASFLIDMFNLRTESIRYKPSLIAAISLELALKFESMVRSNADM